MRLTSNTKASSRRSKRLPWNGRLNRLIFVAERCGTVVEDDFYNKLERLDVGCNNAILCFHGNLVNFQDVKLPDF